jgi:hypothetical protein
MSSFSAIAKNPITGNYELASFMDDYFGNHQYGIKFGDDTSEVYSPDELEIPNQYGHDSVLDIQGYLYMKLAEEAAEIIQRVSKLLIFGYHERQFESRKHFGKPADPTDEEQSKPNIMRLRDEINDFLGTLDYCERLGYMPMPTRGELIDKFHKKRDKLMRYYDYAVKRDRNEL